MRRMQFGAVLMLAMVIAQTGCSKKDGGDVVGPGTSNTPRSAVPDQYVGMWFTGTIGFTNFYNPSNGSWTSGRGFGQFYKLNADGTFEYGWQSYINNYGCSLRGLVYRRGTVVVGDGEMTLYDNFGRAMGESNCYPSSNFDRPDPLLVRKIYFQYQQDEQGNPVMQFRTKDTDFVAYRQP